MPIFQYSARDNAGQLVRETLAFNSEISLREYLRKNNLFVVEIAERRRSAFQGMRRRVGLADLILMTRQIRTMLNAGMPLVSGLEALSEQAPNPRLSEVLTQVGRSVGHGVGLATALAQYPNIFPPMLVALVRAGEEGGRLPETLKEAARQLELQMEMRQRMISAMVYPLFTLAATAGTVIFMMVWVVPVFAAIYKDLGAQLPAITQSVVTISDLLIQQGWMFVLLLVALFFGLQRYYKTTEGHLRMDGWKLKAPLFGDLFLKSASANLTGSLAGLVESGVPLIQALETCAGVCGNARIGEACRAAAASVVTGRRLSDSLEESGHFPIMVTRMIAISEEVGTLPMVLREISDSYISEVEYTIRRLLGLMEPVMILCVAAIVGYVLMALYYPIFLIGDTFSKGA